MANLLPKSIPIFLSILSLAIGNGQNGYQINPAYYQQQQNAQFANSLQLCQQQVQSLQQQLALAQNQRQIQMKDGPSPSGNGTRGGDSAKDILDGGTVAAQNGSAKFVKSAFT